MGAKVQTTGGGAATGLGDDFFKFLQDGLTSGKFTNKDRTPNATKGAFPGFFGAIQNQLRPKQAGQTTPADAMGRTDPVESTGGVAGALNTALAGGPETPNYGTDTTKLTGLADAPGFDWGNFDPSTVDFSQFNTDALKNFDPGINPSAMTANTAGNTQVQDMIGKLFAGKGGGFDPGSLRTEGFAPTDLSPYTALLDRRAAEGTADLRSRFTAGGGTSLGTPAAYAEGNFRAAKAAEDASTLGSITMQDRQSQVGMAGVNASNYGSWLGAKGVQGAQALAGMGQGLDAMTNLLTSDSAQNVQIRGQTIDAAIKSGSIKADALAKSLGMDLDSLNAASKQGLTIQDLMNQRQNNMATDALGNRKLNADIFSTAGDLDLKGQGLKQGFDISKMNMSSDVLRSLMSTLFGGASIGTAQRENVVKPGLLSDIAGIAGAGANIAKAACWVAEELYGVDDPRTHAARHYVMTHDNMFTRAYMKFGKVWAKLVRNDPVIRQNFMPIWDKMAELGRV